MPRQLLHVAQGEPHSGLPESTTPATINPQPRPYLIAADFYGRTRSALDFLRQNGVPVSLVPVTVYAEHHWRRIVDVEADHEPTLPGITPSSGTDRKQVEVNGRRVTVADSSTPVSCNPTRT